MQTEIDTIGNNVANADSDGYQEADVQFSDILTQQLAPGSGSSATLASTDPLLDRCRRPGSRDADDFTQGAIVQDGRCLQTPQSRGAGSSSSTREDKTLYTRAGNFQLDVNGTFSTPDGGIVEGWAGTTPTTGPTGPITIPSSINPRSTGDRQHHDGRQHPLRRGCLHDDGDRIRRQGNDVPLTLTYTPTATANQWTCRRT